MRAINLLPPEQAERSRAARRRLFLGFLLIAYLALLAAGWWFFNQRLGASQDEVVDQQAINDSIQRQITQLDDARQLAITFDDRVAQINEALTVDVEWGRLLNDIGRLIPDTVWINSFTATASEPDEEDDPAFGSVVMAGVAFDYPDAATWLLTLDSAEWQAVGGAWVNNTAAGQIGQIEVVTFSSAASITSGALSNRADQRTPEVPQ